MELRVYGQSKAPLIRRLTYYQALWLTHVVSLNIVCQADNCMAKHLHHFIAYLAPALVCSVSVLASVALFELVDVVHHVGLLVRPLCKLHCSVGYHCQAIALALLKPFEKQHIISSHEIDWRRQPPPIGQWVVT